MENSSSTTILNCSVFRLGLVSFVIVSLFMSMYRSVISLPRHLHAILSTEYQEPSFHSHESNNYKFSLNVATHVFGNSSSEPSTSHTVITAATNSTRPGSSTPIPALVPYYIEPSRRGAGNNSNNTIVKSHAQELLQMAVIGYPKVGTTFLMHRWLGQHDEICMFPEEMHIRSENGIMNWTLLVERLHGLSAERDQCLRAFKSPSFIRSEPGMQAMREYWPRSKLIIGIRHPITWFQSLYNYKIFRGKTTTGELPPPSVDMACGDDGVCVRFANMHRYMAQLGLTPLQDEREMAYLNVSIPFQEADTNRIYPPVPNPVFVYEYTELQSEALRASLTQYLDLKQPLAQVNPNYQNHQTVTKIPGQIDICDIIHAPVRQVLVEIGTAAANWILEYFLASPQVVTTGEKFREALVYWKMDPCDWFKLDQSSSSGNSSFLAVNKT